MTQVDLVEPQVFKSRLYNAWKFLTLEEVSPAVCFLTEVKPILVDPKNILHVSIDLSDVNI